MATIPTQTHAFFSVPFRSTTDFTVLAGHCEQFAETLRESSDTTRRQALSARLAECLAQLQPTLNDPIPPHLIVSLTVDDFPVTSPRFEPDAELLCEYCQALARILMDRALLAEMEHTLTGLLFELVSYFADELRAPRWIRTAHGAKFIAEVERAGESGIS
ncbi:hypothetical protein [Sodalis sp. C49]|uniref:hypothetical protein n=1 Tax=Sodalis sp. C49 TaxID=3228929 RepID=UPI0039659832